MISKFGALAVVLLFSVSFTTKQGSSLNENSSGKKKDSIIYPEEKHFKNLSQLTFGGDNAEAYWSFDNSKLTFQSNNPAWGLSCDQIFYTPVKGSDLKNNKPQLLST